ncbi:bifunctional hydroxymethylpyrimidine kinase/phosphomethylpyrimidine kinase [Pelomonas sp. UHG3]|uniref:Bifunctional hydroxymethylpyrimidine kinase/phosphomethylpyrimidine kinase n=1 Tax=Roseateles hydrophilus TaxID=2975054 RepID=A0ACC6C789_9BURK|nr:bifunctional hydroxymethylpyrimidine kinase/phosphomethylpyrimidine kinase [Pelomonas sp. UHG3]MCY4744255.1 bifunctional hydroxymethylpyrimidine kinase/phosphomethylpyrimidine kinase [Pelomonas sp. UHG3]
MTAPTLWSIAGLDSGGGAGLSADQRAADAFGLPLCPVAAALTAQNSVAVQAVFPVPPEQLDAQLTALAQDLPPAVIKTGLLGGVAQLRIVTRWVDRLRERGPVALVVDPVLRASTGASFADDALLQAYRDELLPRATVVTPNRREAARLVGEGSAPQQARRLGVETACITGGDAAGPLALDWLHSPQASGWLALPRRDARNHHGTGCCFATALAAALARGFVPADAAVLAKMATTSGLLADATPGAGAGPVRPSAGFITDASLLPALFDTPPAAWPARTDGPPAVAGVYGIADSGAQAVALFDAGLRVVQLRLKRADGESGAAWHTRLAAEVQPARDAARQHGATFIVNDHWRAALALGVDFVHLGQEDLLALAADDRADLAQARARGLRLGLSSHSLWELARAVAWAPDYVACGPVWPTLTKAMPWRPQGLDNLAWWGAMSPLPVVGIGGVMAPDQLMQIAAAGAAAGCVVRGLKALPVQDWQAAWRRGLATPLTPEPGWPHPSLDQPPAVSAL